MIAPRDVSTTKVATLTITASCRSLRPVAPGWGPLHVALFFLEGRSDP